MVDEMTDYPDGYSKVSISGSCIFNVAYEKYKVINLEQDAKNINCKDRMSKWIFILCERCNIICYFIFLLYLLFSFQSLNSMYK